MFCNKCGAENKDGAAFCAKCGNSLLSSQSETGNASSNIYGSSASKAATDSPFSKQGQIGNTKIPMAAFVGAAVVLIFILFFAMGSGNKGSLDADEKAVAGVAEKIGKYSVKQDWESLYDLYTKEEQEELDSMNYKEMDLEEEYKEYVYNQFGEYSYLARENAALNDFIHTICKNLCQDYEVGEVVIKNNKDNNTDENDDDAGNKDSEKTAIVKMVFRNIDYSYINNILPDEKGVLEQIQGAANDLFGDSDKNIDKEITEYAKKCKAGFDKNNTIDANEYIEMTTEDGDWKISRRSMQMSDDEWDKMVEEYEESKEEKKK